jgi:ABC-type Mn2+/Zn2+ transport system ATPase subunit
MTPLSNAPQIFSVVGRSGGARMLERAIPLWIGLGIVGAILFGPNGVDPHDLVAWAGSSVTARLTVGVGWLALAAPVVGVLLRDRRADFARALPAGRAASFAAFLGLALLAQLPIAIVFAAGGGPLQALGVAVVGAGASVLLASPSRTRIEIASIASALLAIATGPSVLAALAVSPLLVLGAHRAWVRAPERSAPRGRWVFGPAPLALALAHALRLVRVEAVTVLRAALLAVAGGAVAAIAATNAAGGTSRVAAFALAGLAFPIVLSTSAVAAPIQEADRALDTLLRSTGCSPALRRLAGGLVVSVFGAAVGVLAFVAGRWLAPLPIQGVASAALLGAALGPWILALQHAPEVRDDPRRRRDRGGRLTVMLLAIGAVTAALAVTAGELATVIVAGLGLAGWAVGLIQRRARREASGPTAAVLSMRAVTKRFGGKAVLRGASVDVPAGQIVLLRGVNGSGKSTLLKIAAGVIAADDGDVWIDGAHLESERRRALRALGYVPDASEMPDHLSVAELVSLVAALKGTTARLRERDTLGIAPLLGERLGALSLGQRRRVGLATALLGDPPILVLDEPTNGLDVDGLAVLARLLTERRAAGACALLASHDTGFGDRLADRVLVLDGGVTSVA